MPAWMQQMGRWLRQHPVAAVVLAALGSLVAYWQLTPAPPSRSASPVGAEAPAFSGTLPPRVTLEAAMARLQQDTAQLRLTVGEQQKVLTRLEQAQQMRDQAYQRELAERDSRWETLQQQTQQVAQQAQEAIQKAVQQTQQVAKAAEPATQVVTRPPSLPTAPPGALLTQSTIPRPTPPIIRVLRPEKPPATVPQALTAADSPWAYLPAGSFVRGRLLTGLFATSQAEGALPVLFAVRDAFTGPNQTALPLQGCLMLGKTQADLASLRAIVQLTTLACVLPDGRTLERTVTGYATGPDGTLGLPGRLESRAGTYIANTFLTSLIAGAAAAFARAESTVQVTPFGGTATTVTGDAGRYAAFSALATGTARLADFYRGLAEKLLPVVWVEAGQDVHMVLQQGLTLDGLPATVALPAPLETN